MQVYPDYLDRLKKSLADEESVLLAYLFGSRAVQNCGALSDIDVAVYVGAEVDTFRYRLRLIEDLSRATGAEKIDLVILNDATPLLKHEVIKVGVVLKGGAEERVPFEAAVLREYLDTAYLRDTQRAAIRERVREGTYFG
jgi:uncharacterized protein